MPVLMLRFLNAICCCRGVPSRSRSRCRGPLRAGANRGLAGSILTWAMRIGMNRSLLDVLIGQKKTKGGAAKPKAPEAAPPAAAPAAAAPTEPKGCHNDT